MNIFTILLLSLLGLLQCQLAQGAEQGEDGTYEFRTTLPILGDKFHTSCDLHAGFNLTMIHCRDQYEVYDTQAFVEQQSGLKNYGEVKKIYGVRNSLRVNDNLSITFLEGNTVKRLYRDVSLPVDEQVIVEKVVTLALQEEDWAWDAYVLSKNMVAVRVNDRDFQFFQDPLVNVDVVQPLPFDESEDEFTNQQLLTKLDYGLLMDVGFAPNNIDQNYTLFGIKRQEIIRVNFTYDEEESQMLQNVTSERYNSLNGTLQRIAVTREFVIISDSNGQEPGISFFDHDFNLVKFFPRPKLLESPYILKVYNNEVFETIQVFVSGPDNLSIIEQVKNDDGDVFFNIVDDVFVGKTKQPYTSDQTYVAKSSDYLIMKQSSTRTLGLMPLCAYKYAFINETFSCRPCELGLKSYGLQSVQCITCMRAWFKGGNGNDFREAQFEQFCHEGQVYSIVLFAMVPSVVCLAGFICCATHQGNKIQEYESQEDSEKKKRMKYHRKGSRVVRIVKKSSGNAVNESQRYKMKGTFYGDKFTTENSEQPTHRRVDTDAHLMMTEPDQLQTDRQRMLYNDDDKQQDIIYPQRTGQGSVDSRQAQQEPLQIKHRFIEQELNRLTVSGISGDRKGSTQPRTPAIVASAPQLPIDNQPIQINQRDQLVQQQTVQANQAAQRTQLPATDFDISPREEQKYQDNGIEGDAGEGNMSFNVEGEDDIVDEGYADSYGDDNSHEFSDTDQEHFEPPIAQKRQHFDL